MYHTGRNYLEQKHTTAAPSIPHASHLGATQWGNPFEQAAAASPTTKRQDDDDDEMTTIRQNNTMPTILSSCCSYDTTTTDDDNGNEYQNIMRTGSGSILPFRNLLKNKRATVEGQRRRLISRQRAAEMIAQYELSDDKPDSLNRKANFGPGPLPSLGSSLAGQQAVMAAYHSSSHNNHHSRREVVLGDKERDEWDKRTFASSSVATTAASTLSRPPLTQQGNSSYNTTAVNKAFTFEEALGKPKKKTRAQQRIDIARATRMRLVAEQQMAADQELPSEIGMDIVPLSPGIYSIASTMTETPTSRCHPPTTTARVTQEVHRLC